MRRLNLRFFLLQGLLILVECITISYISPILVSLGYSNLRIGWVMTLGTLASTLARPVWGVVNDRYSRPKQVILTNIALGSACYFLLTHGGGRPALTAMAVMGMHVTIVCMANFTDSWALRLISGGAALNYGVTRAGGSLSYAVGAVLFGAVSARWGFQPGNYILWCLFVLMCAVMCALPNPPAPEAGAEKAGLRRGLAALAGNRPYLLMLLALFLTTLASCPIESFSPVLILSLGGTEQHVGVALFVQAMSELPVMAGYARLRKRLRLSPAALIGVSMLCWGLRALALSWASALWMVLAAALFQSLTFALFTTACVDFMLETVPADCLSTAYLVFLALGQGASAMLGNTMGGALADHLGIQPMFRLVSLLALTGSLLAWRVTRLQRAAR